MRTVLLMTAITLLVGCAENPPRLGDKITLKPYHPPKLIAGESAQICILVDATNPNGQIRQVRLGVDALTARVEFFNMHGESIDYENMSFRYG